MRLSHCEGPSMTGMSNKLGIGVLVMVAMVSSSCAEAGTLTRVGKLLIDTDAGADDAVAIIMAAEAERFGDGPKIIGITCVNGNTNVSQVAVNVLKTLNVVNRLEIPVYIGAASPLLKAPSTDHYFGQDAFGDFEYPDPPSVDLIQSKHAVNAMIDLVKAHPGEVTILALGPLTNVALAISMYPPFLDELQQLIIMGGSTEGRGNTRPGMEFNFFADPHANYVVFNKIRTNPVTLIPFETTRRAPLKMTFRLSLNETNNRKIWLINNAGVTTLNTNENWYSADAIATAVALAPDSIVTESDLYYSEAVPDGVLTAGMIIVDYTNITDNNANTNLIRNIDRDGYEQMFLKYFIGGK